MDCSTSGFLVLYSLPKLSQTQVHWVGDAVEPCHPLLPPSPWAFNLCQHQGIFNESDLCIRWPKYQNFSFIINPFNEYSELISLRIDWFDLFAVQGTLESFLQHHNLKALILQCSAFFMVLLSHPFMTTGKTLTIQTFVSKVISLLFNMLSRFVIAFLPRRKVSFTFMATGIICSDFGAQENKTCHCFPLFPLLFAMKWWDQMPWYSLSESWVLS